MDYSSGKIVEHLQWTHSVRERRWITNGLTHLWRSTIKSNSRKCFSKNVLVYDRGSSAVSCRKHEQQPFNVVQRGQKQSEVARKCYCQCKWLNSETGLAVGNANSLYASGSRGLIRDNGRLLKQNVQEKIGKPVSFCRRGQGEQIDLDRYSLLADDGTIFIAWCIKAIAGSLVQPQ